MTKIEKKEFVTYLWERGSERKAKCIGYFGSRLFTEKEATEALADLEHVYEQYNHIKTIKKCIEALNAILKTLEPKLLSFKITMHEGKQNPSFEGCEYTTWKAAQDAINYLWEANENNNSNGGYTKVFADIRLENGIHKTRIDLAKTAMEGYNPGAEKLKDHVFDLINR